MRRYDTRLRKLEAAIGPTYCPHCPPSSSVTRELYSEQPPPCPVCGRVPDGLVVLEVVVNSREEIEQLEASNATV